MPQPGVYAKLARLFDYPGDDYSERVRECRQAMRSENAEAARLFEEFAAAVEGIPTYALQEMFTRTFDLNPACTLEIGWHLYGEDYKRGEFLVKMRQQLREHELAESGELPDHLTHALVLLEAMGPEEAATFAPAILLPSLDKMRAAWKENHNAYRSLLDSVFALLSSRYPYQPAQHSPRTPELPVLE